MSMILQLDKQFYQKPSNLLAGIFTGVILPGQRRGQVNEEMNVIPYFWIPKKIA